VTFIPMKGTGKFQPVAHKAGSYGCRFRNLILGNSAVSARNCAVFDPMTRTPKPLAIRGNAVEQKDVTPPTSSVRRCHFTGTTTDLTSTVGRTYVPSGGHRTEETSGLESVVWGIAARKHSSHAIEGLCACLNLSCKELMWQQDKGTCESKTLSPLSPV
jgi:hypothetical protein